MNDAGTICVTGKGMIRLKPDTMRITVTLEGKDPDYARTLERSAEDAGKIRDALLPVGFEREDLKTLNFRVETEYEGYQEEGVYRQRIVGYLYRHELKIEFPSDNERLGRVLATLANAALTPDLRISFTVKDIEAAKNALLGAAVADARKKATTLVEAEGVRLGRIRHLRYSMHDSEFAVHPVMYAGMARKACADSMAPEIEPEEITAEDTVTVVWEIE